jgi:ATP-binding cassette subfamily B (MDR/TAP) protein 1
LIAFVAAKAAVQNVYYITDRKPLIDGLSDEGLRPDIKISGKIELRSLFFAYPTRPDIQVCKNYNMQINPGETVALVGTSGSGKVFINFNEYVVSYFLCSLRL